MYEKKSNKLDRLGENEKILFNNKTVCFSGTISIGMDFLIATPFMEDVLVTISSNFSYSSSLIARQNKLERLSMED
jgi:hypothetical protein